LTLLFLQTNRSEPIRTLRLRTFFSQNTVGPILQKWLSKARNFWKETCLFQKGFRNKTLNFPVANSELFASATQYVYRPFQKQTKIYYFVGITIPKVPLKPYRLSFFLVSRIKHTAEQHNFIYLLLLLVYCIATSANVISKGSERYSQERVNRFAW